MLFSVITSKVFDVPLWGTILMTRPGVAAKAQALAASIAPKIHFFI
jgi:hypothetical protein